VSTTALPRRRPSRGRQSPRPRPAAAPRSRPTTRARTTGRAASASNYLAVAVVGTLLCLIVTLQIQALRDNMHAGQIDRHRRDVLTSTVNLRAGIAQMYPRAKIDVFAAQNGMVLAPPSAYQQLRVPSS
jgi:hypothetical protein